MTLRYTQPRRLCKRLKNPQAYTIQESIEVIKNNPQVYTTQEGIGVMKNNPRVYTTREGMQEIRKKLSGIHYPRGYSRD